MIDFTSMYAAENACRAKKIISLPDPKECGDCDNHSHQGSESCYSQPTSEKRFRSASDDKHDIKRNDQMVQKKAGKKSSLLLIGLVGDSLLEPFWPTGSGCGRGFLSAMDSGWMCREWAIRKCSISNQESVLSVLRERESIYRLLPQTKPDNLCQNYASYTLNPTSRYPNLNSSNMLLHQCKHLLYDDVSLPIPYAESSASHQKSSSHQSLAAKRLRRATIATSSFDSILSDKVIQEESASSSISESRGAADVVLNRFAPKNRSSLYAPSSSFRMEKDEDSCQEFEECLAAFEENYHHGLMSSNSASAIPSHLQSFINSSKQSNPAGTGNMSEQQNMNMNELMMSPSANNLASIGKTRAKDIETALRHRRQQQMEFKRGSFDCGSSSRVTQRRLRNELLQMEQHQQNVMMARTIVCSDHKKSRVAWFLEQQNQKDHNHAENNSCCSTSSHSSSCHKNDHSEPVNFANRIRDLEAKLYAASGCIDPSSSSPHSSSSCFPVEADQQKKIINSKGSSIVMKTASTLEKILNPSFQDEKLKEKAKDYRKKNSDIKIVSKMTTETDWNKKCWDEREKRMEGKNTTPQYPQYKSSYPFKNSVRSFLPPNHFLKRRNRSQSFFYYCPSQLNLFHNSENDDSQAADGKYLKKRTDDNSNYCDVDKYYMSSQMIKSSDINYDSDDNDLFKDDNEETICDQMLGILWKIIFMICLILFSLAFPYCSILWGLTS